MNTRNFKTVFSKRLGALVAVGEHASSQGKANGASAGGGFGGFAGFVGTLTVGFALVGLAWAGPVATALPTGGQVAQGVASISQSGAVMNISQSSAKAVVNWNSFDIGAGAKVNIVQPGADAVMLNRVTGANPSQILGQLNANGQVVLVNPNGVLFGKDGSVNATSFTASTLGISDANFMAGNMQFDRNGSTASVVNQGSIKATGGYVALLGASVTNEGKIETQGCTAYLAAAETVKVPVSGSGRIKLELSPSSINAAVSNAKGGTIVTEGGQVYMQAAALNSAVASIIQSGNIDTKGEQGGAVHLLADGGNIKVDGSITANSTGQDDKGQQRKGGDIVIGRDEDTAVLAASTDVSGARLESGKGFVETSGHQLTVEGTQVTAKDWLLDPDNIDITGDATAATSGYSKIKASDIATALNAGSSVTVSTTAATQVNQPGYTDTAGTGTGTATAGDGNILVSAAIVKSGSNNASLTLLADNGITVNQRIGRAAADTTSNGKLDVVMTANGGVEGTSSKGITLNNVIDANGGQVTLTGTSKDTSGVQTGPTYTYGVTNNSRSGVVFNTGSGIIADNYQVTGTHTVAAGNSFGVNGVYMSGAVTFKATGNTDSNITGDSNAQGNFGAGVMVWDGAVVRLENQGTGLTTLKGPNTNTTGGNGIRIGASTNTATINAIGRVTLGQKTAGVNAPVFVRGIINASLNTSSLGGLSVLGQTGTGLNTSAVQIWDTNINATGIDVLLDGVTNNATGVYIQTAPNNTWATKNLTVSGVANTTSGSSGAGVVVQRYPGVLTVNASGNIAIEGSVQGTGSGSGLSFAQSGWGPQSPSLTATGNITLRGNNRASTSNTSNAVSIASGVQVSASGNIVLQAETNNAAATAILANSSGNFADWTAASNAGAGALNGNMSLKSTSGDVLIQSNQGSIVLNNQLTSTLVNGTQTTSTDITGRNITIDNTGAGMATGAGTAVTGTGGTQGATLGSGSIDAATGVITRGAGKSTSSTAGVRMADGRAITAKNNINIFGAGTTGSGVEISGAAALSANVVGYTGNINIAGENTTSSGAAVNISNALSTITALNIATLISSGTGSGTSLVAAGNITVGGELQVENPVAGTISGVIGGTGMLRKRGGTGAGTLTLTGENTYTGGTTANGGMLQVGNGGTTGTLGVGGAISMGAALSFKRSNTLEISQNISGVGQISQIGTGTTILTGTNSYSGTTTVSSGGLQIGNSGTTGTLGAGAVSVASGANLSFKRSDTWTVVNAISGAGNLTQEGSGTTVLTGTNTYTGTTTISAGTLQVGNGGTSGTLGTGAVIDNSALIFNRNDSLTVAVAISGSGTLTQAGAGTTILTGTNSYSGTTTISAGVLQVGNGGTSGTLGSGAITDNASLAFNRSDSLTIANAISGTGSLTQSGAGTTTFTANNTYLGTTSVSSGTLQIGNGGSTGTLGVGDVTLSNNANLSYVRSASTSIDNKISGAGNVSASITGSTSALSVNKDIDLVNGTVNLAADSDVTLAAKVITTSGSASAIILNAGKPSAAGTASGGNILVSGSAAVSAGAGGRATLFTGSVSGSTGLAALVGSGSGRFRYNSDEISANYTTALGSGLYGIYREKPTLTAAVNNEVKTYDGQSYSGASGSITALTGFANGDTNAQLGTVSYSASSAKNSGAYNITGTASSGLGYAVALSSGTLTVNKADLVLSGSRVYDRGTTFAGQYLTATGVNGETFSVTGTGDIGNLSSKNVQTNQVLSSVTSLALGASSNGGLSTNYNALSTTGSSVSVTAKSASVSATVTNLIYNGTLQAQQNYTSSGFVTGDTITVSGVSSGTNAGTYASNMAVSGADASNYNITLTNANLVIGKANLTLSGRRTYDAGTTFAGTYLTANGVNGETFSVTGDGDSSNLASKAVQTHQALASVTGLSLGASSNDGLSSNYNALSTSGSSVNVTAKAATINGTTTNLTYNGATQTQSAATTTGIVGGDAVTVGGLASGKNAGTYASNLSVSGADIGNYSFTYNNANLVIGKASLTATANSSVVTYNGTSQSVSGFTVSGLLGSDQVSDLTGISASGASGTNAGNYTSTMQSAAQTNYTVSTVNGSLQINKAPLTATLVGSINKVYDGTTAASNLTGANYSVTGWATVGEGVTVNHTAATYASATVANNGGTGSVSTTLQASDFAVVGSTNLGNYTLPTSATGLVGTITAAPLTVKVNNTSMFVTQTPGTAVDNGFSFTGLKNGESAATVLGVLTRNYTGAANPATGSYSGVYDLTAVPTAANYAVTVQKGDLTVVAADKLLINVGSVSATYGTLTAANAGSGASGVTAQYCLVASNCNGANIANLAMSNAGTRWTATDSSNSTISFNTVVDTTGKLSTGGFVNMGNYNFGVDSLSTTGPVNFNGTALNSGVLTVDPKTLGLSAGAVTKVYDGTRVLAGMALTPSGGMSGDQIQVASTGGSFAGKNVGSQGFTLTGLQLQGSDRANYAFAANTVTGTGSITPKALTLSASAVDKVYDGNTSASVGGLSLSGVIAGDAVSASGGSASFADKNVARDVAGHVVAKSVSISGVTLAGADAGNYTADPNAGATARITPLTVSASVAASDKVYDGSANASVFGRVNGLIGTDAVSAVSANSFFASKNVARNAAGQLVSQTVTAAGLSLTGADAVNYSLSNTTATSSATITPKTLQASGAVADKVYDGSAQASLAGLNGTGIVAGDAVTVQATSAAFEDKNVARDASGHVVAKTVTVTGLSLSGANAGNYELQGSSFTTQAQILPRALSLVAVAQDKSYDGTAMATGSVSATNLVPGDAVQLSWVGGEFASKDVSRNAQGHVQAQAVSFGNVQISGAVVGNYSLVDSTAKAIATIMPKVLTVTGTWVADKQEDGNTSAKVTMGLLSGLVGQEHLLVTALGNFQSAAAGSDKSVDVNYSLQDGANGGKSGNYTAPLQLLKANILATGKNNPVQPIVVPSKPASSSKVVIANAQAAVGRSDTESKNEIRQECSFLHPEKCECQDTAVVGVQLCVAPAPAEARGVDLTDRLNAVLGLPAK